MHVRALTYTSCTNSRLGLPRAAVRAGLFTRLVPTVPPSAAIADYIVLILLERLVPRDSIDAVVDYPSTRSDPAEESTVAHEQISADSSSAALFADEKKTN